MKQSINRVEQNTSESYDDLKKQLMNEIINHVSENKQDLTDIKKEIKKATKAKSLLKASSESSLGESPEMEYVRKLKENFNAQMNALNTKVPYRIAVSV